tara:strand:+ start:12776 stop:21292 length:8517 start_codon:yes stop_codon:yes gene_type:complete
MNPEALQYSYDLFSKDGYNGSLEDYKQLISTNDEALQYSFNLFSTDGYNGNMDSFKNLVIDPQPRETAAVTEVETIEEPEEPTKVDDFQEQVKLIANDYLIEGTNKVDRENPEFKKKISDLKKSFIEDEKMQQYDEELSPLALELQATLNNIEDEDGDFKTAVMEGLVYDDQYRDRSGEREDGIDLTVQAGPEAKTKAELLNDVMEAEEKPGWMSDDVWKAVTNYTAFNEIPEDYLKTLPERRREGYKKAAKDKATNLFFHDKELDEDQRKRVIGLLADQKKGKLTRQDVARFSNDPSLLQEAYKIQNNELATLTSDMEQLRESESALVNNDRYKELNAEAELVGKQIQAMDQAGISADSPAADIEKYNSLVTQFKNIQKQFENEGFEAQRAEQAEKIKQWQIRRENLMANAQELDDVSLGLNIATKNYSEFNRALLNLESSFLGGTSMTVAGIVSDIGHGIASVQETLGFEEQAAAIRAGSDVILGAAVDYNATLAKRQEDFAAPVTFEDVSWSTLDSFVANNLANAAPSITAVLGSRTGGKVMGPSNAKVRASYKNGKPTQETFQLKAKQQNALKKSSNLAAASFFTMGYGGKRAELEIAQREAPDAINYIKTEILGRKEELELTPGEVKEYENQIEGLERQLNLSTSQKAISSLIAGSTDLLAEKYIGSLSYINNLQKVRSAVGDKLFKRAMYGGLNTTINVGQELIEESAVQVANNISDIWVLDEDKSIADGLNADFVSNVVISSLAIQGPSMGQGMWSTLSTETKKRSDIKRNKALFKEVLEIQESLENRVGLTDDQLKELENRKTEIFETAGINNMKDFMRLNDMPTEKKYELFDMNRRKREILSNLTELGGRGDAGSKSVKKQKERLVDEYNQIESQREELLNAKDKKNLQKVQDAANPALAAYNIGMYEFYRDIVGTVQAQNGNEMNVITNETTEQELSEKYGSDIATALIEKRNSGTNATFVGDNVILFGDNIENQVKLSNTKTSAGFAAVSPLHELLHIQNRKAGIVNDRVVVGLAQQGIKEAENIIKENKDLGKISDEVYNEFLQRKKAYTTSKRKRNQQLKSGQITQKEYDDLEKNEGVDIEEMLNMYSDFVAMGVLSQYDFNKIDGLKYTLKSLINKFNLPQTQFLFPMKTGSDVFNYIKSFQKDAQKLRISQQPEPEETEESLKESLGTQASQKVQELYDEQGEAAAMDIIDQFKPIVNKIVQRRSEAPGFDRQLLTDEIETGDRGLFDLIRSYDPESGVPLAAYINKFLPSRAIEASKRVLGEQFDEDVDEQVGLAAIEEADNEVVEKPKRKIKLKNRLSGNVNEAVDKIKSEVDNLPIDQLNFKSLKNIATEEVQKLFGIKPKPGNLTKDDVRNAQQYINNNAELLIAMLPEGATPSGTSTGVQKVLLDNFYNKTERATMAKTGSKAGLTIFEKRNNITPADFKQVFGITPAGQPNVSDRNTSARIKALVAQTERMLTNQEVREVLEQQGRNIPQALIEGKPELLASVGTKLTAKQKKLIQQQEELMSLDEGGLLLLENKDWKQIVKDYGFDPINMRTEEGRQKLKSILFEGSKDYPPLISFLPKSFFTQAGTFTNGAENTSVKPRKFLTDKQLKALLKAKSEGILSSVSSNEVVREYTLNDGSKVLNTDPRFVTREVQLSLKPVGTFLFANKLQLDQAIKQAQDLGEQFAKENPKIAAAVKKEGYSNLEKKFKTKDFKDQQELKQEGFKELWLNLESAIQLNPKVYAPAVAALFSSTSGAQRHAGRVSAPIAFLNTLGLKNVEEHTEPASDINKYLFNRALQGNLDLYIDGALSSYFQGQLPDVFDKMLKGEDFNYVKNVPAEYAYDVLMGIKSVWIRYFNPNVNSQIRVDENGITRKGIDPNVLIEANGKSVAENFGVGVNKKQITPSVIAKQQDLLFKILDNQITQDQATKELNEFLKLSPDIQVSKKQNVLELKDSKVLDVNDNLDMDAVLSKAATIDEALRMARRNDPPIRKIRVFDFDDTLATSNNIVFASKDGETIELNAEQFAEKGLELKQEGWEMDFSDFNRVTDGGRGPLFNIAKKIRDARGNEDLFVLTARAPQAQEAIYDFLKSQGLEFKRENIIGLGNSTGEAKANWIIGKAAEGYNDFYFADDALQNVRAVQDALEVIDVKSKVQQAKLKESKNLNKDFNDILSDKAGIESDKIISDARAKVAGPLKDKFKFWIPYSAEDFMGLIYPTLSKGKKGELQMDWYKKNLLTPYSRAMENLSKDRLQLMQDFRVLKQKLDVPKNLKKTNGTGFTNEQAVRVWLYNEMGYEIPGMDQKDIDDLVELVNNNPEYKVFGQELLKITKGDGWAKPSKDWLVGTLTTDLIDLLNTTKRDKYLQEFNDNVAEIYSEKNLNKLEAAFGSKYREAIENMLTRMKSGKNRTSQGSRLSNRILDYINSSNAAIMFFNTRSAILQTISSVNFVNWTFNNPLNAGKAFANQSQYWKDFMTLMNSDFLRDRRQGQRIDISSNEIADAAKTAKNKAKAAMAYILEKGYLPTQYADSFAIAAGGATFYRNRINDLISQGLSVADAESQALREFREIAEESQQSSRPDKISMQQASDYGRLILMFGNTPMQYARLQKRAFQDLVNGRGSARANISKIAYYGFVQNMIFNALQQAVFAIGFGDDDEEKDEERVYDTINGMSDSILRGLGIGGVATSVVKNFLLDIYERSGRSRPEYVDSVWKLTQFSPPIASKISKIRQALWQFNSKKRRQEVFEKGFSLDNPAFQAGAKVVSGTANVPLDRVLQKMENLTEAFEEETEWWQTIAMLAGWPKWQLEQKEREYINKKKISSKRVSNKKSSRGRNTRNKRF